MVPRINEQGRHADEQLIGDHGVRLRCNKPETQWRVDSAKDGGRLRLNLISLRSGEAPPLLPSGCSAILWVKNLCRKACIPAQPRHNCSPTLVDLLLQLRLQMVTWGVKIILAPRIVAGPAYCTIEPPRVGRGRVDFRLWSRVGAGEGAFPTRQEWLLGFVLVHAIAWANMPRR
jgi:hypothetical protein